MYQMILRGARLENEVVDIGVADGRVRRIAPSIEGRAEHEIDADGRLVSPPFIESHVHLDTTLTAGEPRWNESGTLFEGIQIWSERKKSVSHQDVIERATRLLRWQAAQGVLHVRTHVDVTDPELTGLKAILEVKEKVRDWIDVQIVAFPQEGILSYPKGAELMEEALKLGADVVGGIPHYEHTREMGAESVKETFRLAEKHGIAAEVYSATSFPMLRRDALAVDRWNRLHPGVEPRTPYVSTILGAEGGPIVVATDWMKALPDLVRPWVDAPFGSLGTDGFGRSDTRDALRSYFEIDPPHIAAAAISELVRAGSLTAADAAEAFTKLGIDPDKPDPLDA